MSRHYNAASIKNQDRVINTKIKVLVQSWTPNNLDFSKVVRLDQKINIKRQTETSTR